MNHRTRVSYFYSNLAREPNIDSLLKVIAASACSSQLVVLNIRVAFFPLSCHAWSRRQRTRTSLVDQQPPPCMWREKLNIRSAYVSSSPLLWPAIKPFSATLKSKAHTNHTWPAYKHSIQIKHTTYSPRYPPQHFFLFIQRNLLVGAIALRVSTGQDLISIPMVLRIPFVHWIKPFQRYYTYSDTSHSILFIHIYCSHRTLLAHCELIALQVVLFCRAIE